MATYFDIANPPQLVDPNGNIQQRIVWNGPASLLYYLPLQYVESPSGAGYDRLDVGIAINPSYVNFFRLGNSPGPNAPTGHMWHGINPNTFNRLPLMICATNQQGPNNVEIDIILVTIDSGITTPITRSANYIF